MNYRDASDVQIQSLVKSCINKMYADDAFLFLRNNKRGVCERSLVFRLAYYLQSIIGDEFYVDCDFNSSFETETISDGTTVHRERSGKPILNADGTVTKRYVDIIVHRRDYNTDNDFICFEIKKWNNDSPKKRKKDLNNLKVLTTLYGYRLGFFIVLGRKRDNTKWRIFSNGLQDGENQIVF